MRDTELKVIFTSAKEEILAGMIKYMQDGDTDYGISHVNECGVILDTFFTSANSANSSDQYLSIVRETVLKLNTLTEAVEDIIETQEREDICLLIMDVGSSLGFNDPDEDVTEEWREW